MKIDRQVLPARRWRRPAARRSIPPHRDGASPGPDAPRHFVRLPSSSRSPHEVPR